MVSNQAWAQFPLNHCFKGGGTLCSFNLHRAHLLVFSTYCSNAEKMLRRDCCCHCADLAEFAEFAQQI